ncbi:hypothetical protein DFH27DRAFT_529001 [Peziza echinospora]|nr:hypothetical protein DFH27DRAFT_529001 [Peziza echinospora]
MQFKLTLSAIFFAALPALVSAIPTSDINGVACISHNGVTACGLSYEKLCSASNFKDASSGSIPPECLSLKKVKRHGKVCQKKKHGHHEHEHHGNSTSANPTTASTTATILPTATTTSNSTTTATETSTSTTTATESSTTTTTTLSTTSSTTTSTTESITSTTTTTTSESTTSTTTTAPPPASTDDDTCLPNSYPCELSNPGACCGGQCVAMNQYDIVCQEDWIF